MKAAELFVRCLENEGIEYLFGLPGEENIDLLDALHDSPIKVVTTRHEQGAGFMADVYGRLTGRAGVCFATLGPGATNLITPVADANMDYAPLVAIAGQAATTRFHKITHQHLDLVNLFRPITKFATQILEPEVIPEVIRKAFKQAQTEKPGAAFIDLPENIAQMPVEGKEPLRVQYAMRPVPPEAKIRQAAELISAARFPLVLAGNGVIRDDATPQLRNFVEKLNLPVATTFMAKGAIPFSHPLSLGAIGLQAQDYVFCGFDRADLVICVGYDMVEYHPNLWNPEGKCKIIHVDVLPAEVDEHYIVEAGVVGDISTSLERIAAASQPREKFAATRLRETIVEELSAHAGNPSFPLTPQRIVWDLRQALEPEDVVICDVGAHKMWMARMFQAEHPRRCIISNGFASMGISLPGAIAAKLALPQHSVVAVAGDAAFLMNCQELETAVRLETPLVVLVWNDSKYGLIEWHQLRHFGRTMAVEFGNPDFVQLAESFGARGYRVRSADELVPTLREACNCGTVAVIDCPVDYSENMKLTEKLGKLVCPI